MDSIALLGPNPNFDLPRFLNTADRIAPAFVDKTRGMRELVDSSILFSDGLCVSALCEMYEVDHLIESGTGFGGSTEMFARYFADHATMRKIWSVDRAVHPAWAWMLDALRIKDRDPHVWSSRRRARHIAKARLSPFTRVELVRGDAFRAIPAILNRLDARQSRVGIVIDGPKEAAQLSLAHQLLESSPQVCFAALDDIGPMFDDSGRYARFCRSTHAVFATSDRAFYARYGWVNDGRLPARMQGHPDHTGYGVGILVNSDPARSR